MMFCKNCGAQLEDSVTFCTQCGVRLSKPAPAPEAVPMPEAPPVSEPVLVTEAAPIAEEAPAPETVSAAEIPVPEAEPVSEAASAPVREFVESHSAPPMSETVLPPPVGFAAGKPVKEKTFFGVGALVFCLIIIGVLSIATGVFAGLYFSAIA